MKTEKLFRLIRAGILCALLACCTPVLTRAQAVNDLLIQMLSYDYNCATGMATVKYHITNSDASGHVGGYNTSYTINLGVYSTSGFIANGDDDVEFTGGYIIGDIIECRAVGVGNNFTYPMSFDYMGYLPRPAKPYIYPFASTLTICSDQPVTLYANHAGPDPGNYIWSNGQTGSSITVSASGTYTVQEIGSCANSDPSDPITIVVNNAPSAPVIYASPQTVLCNGGSTGLYTSPTAGGTIHWSTGETGNSIAVSSPGTYYAYEVNDCGQSGNSNSVTITAINTSTVPSVSAASSLLCNGASTTITAIPANGGTIYWNTGQTGNTITVSAAGTYYVYEGTSCGTSSYSNSVTIVTGSTPAAPVISSSNGTLLCNGSLTTLNSSSGGGTINWNHGQTGTSITVSGANSYYTTETNGCGTSAASNIITIATGSSPAPPAINSTGGLLLCNGAGTTLNAGGVNGTVTWSTGQTGSSINVSAAGTYYATNTNSCGTSAQSNALVIAVDNTPSAPGISSNTSTVCNGSSAILSASGTGTINWFLNGSLYGSPGSSISTALAGNYYAQSSNGCGSSGNSNTITIASGSTPTAPTVNASGSYTLCDGASKTLTVTASAGGALHWNTGATSNSITVSQAGSYYVYESNSCGNSANSSTVNITTLNSPAAPVVTPPGSQLLCNGQTFSFNATGSSITWSNGATGNNMVTGAAGTYYAYDHNACGNSANSNTVVITTGNCPAPTPGTSFFICPGALKTLDAGAGYDTYQWSNGATTRTISVGPGNYAVTVSKQGCYATSVTVSVSYYSVTVPVISTSGVTTFCQGGTVSLSSSAGSTYLWSNGSTSSSTTVATSGSYFVTVTDGNGCQATSAPVTVSVNPLPSATIAGTTAVCKNANSPTVTFTGNGATSPYTFYYNINGGSMQTITASGSSVTLAVPTNLAGTFTYNLVGVQESSSTSCYNTVSGSATVTVKELPTASIAGTTTVCLNSASPLISFTGSNGVAPYTFTYSINGGSSQSVTTTSGNSVTVTAPTTTAGSFTYALLAVQEASSLACSVAASGNAVVTVRPLPTATVSGNTIVCQNSASPSVIFSGASGNAPYTFTYNINGGAAQTVSTVSGNSVAVNVPTGTAGTFTYNLIGVQESGTGNCANSAIGSASVVVNPLPSATISGSTTVCQNSAQPAITFTGINATAPYTFSYRINGGAVRTVSTVTGNSVTVNVPTDQPGSFTYELLTVQESSSTTCINAVTGAVTVVVRALPTATISGSTTVCLNSTAPIVTFTGSTGSAPYTFSYRINGGTVQSVTATSGNSVGVEVPTSASGSFVYTLVGVQESGSPSCLNAASGSVTVTVNPLPTATISGTTTVCQNGASPLVTFTGSDATAPYTFNYKINGGTVQSVTTITGNSVTVPVSTAVAGFFTYELISVQEASSVSCSNTAIGSVKITINPQPPAAVLLAPQSHLCNGETGQLTIYNWTEGYTYRWYKDGVLFATATGQTMAITQAGNYTVLVTSDLGCDAAALSNAVVITTGSIPAPVITGSLKVCEGGTTVLTVFSSDKRTTYELYRWTDTPIGDSLGNRQSFSALAGQYCVRVAKEGCYDSLHLVVTANDTEYPAGKLILTPDSIAYGGQVTIRGEVTGASVYQWDFGNDRKMISTTPVMLQHYYLRSDSVLVKLQAVSERNCRTEFSALLKIALPDTLVFADKSFTGNLKDWNLFPVPFHDDLKLSVILKHNETVRLDLFSLDGSWLRSWQFSGKKGENLFRVANAASLQPGVLYMVTAYYNGEKHFDKIYKY